MTRYIDADALMEYLTMMPIDLGYREVEEIERFVNEAPTIDAVPVIRCKDCKHWESMPSSTAAPEIHRCRYWRHIGTCAFDYCGRAERKEE